MAKFTVDIPAGPIWDQKDAEKKCPLYARRILGNGTVSGRLWLRAR
jgi:hypothetical protein